MHTHLHKHRKVAIVVAVLALLLIGYFGFGIMKKPEAFRQPLLADSAIVHGAVSGKKALTPTPLSKEALDAVTTHTPAPSVSAPTSPTTLQGFLSLFSGKKTTSADVTGVIEMVNAPQGLLALFDAQTGKRYTVFADERAKITREGEVVVFGALKVSDIVHVYGQREDVLQLISASTIAITGALPIPPAL